MFAIIKYLLHKHFQLSITYSSFIGFEFSMENQNILDGRQEERFYGREEKEKSKEHSDVYDKGIKCWSVCAVSFLLQFLVGGQVNSFGAVMLVSLWVPIQKIVRSSGTIFGMRINYLQFCANI